MILTILDYSTGNVDAIKYPNSLDDINTEEFISELGYNLNDISYMFSEETKVNIYDISENFSKKEVAKFIL